MKQLEKDIHGAKLRGYIWEDAPFLSPSSKRPAVIVCPGGGYTHLSPREGEPVAMKFYAEGYNAFVLEYSVIADKDGCGAFPLWPKPLEQLSFAVAYVRMNASETGTDAADISVIGFSAGGHLAACLGTMYNRKEFSEKLGIEAGMNRPDRLILGYPCLSGRLYAKERENAIAETLLGRGNTDENAYARINALEYVTENTPPSFVFVTFADRAVLCGDGIEFAQRLYSCSVPCELHAFSDGTHGFSLAVKSTAASKEQISKSASMWFELALYWLERLRNE